MSRLSPVFDFDSQTSQFVDDIGSSPNRSLVCLPFLEQPEQGADLPQIRLQDIVHRRRRRTVVGGVQAADGQQEVVASEDGEIPSEEFTVILDATRRVRFGQIVRSL